MGGLSAFLPRITSALIAYFVFFESILQVYWFNGSLVHGCFLSPEPLQPLHPSQLTATLIQLYQCFINFCNGCFRRRNKKPRRGVPAFYFKCIADMNNAGPVMYQILAEINIIIPQPVFCERF